MMTLSITRRACLIRGNTSSNTISRSINSTTCITVCIIVEFFRNIINGELGDTTYDDLPTCESNTDVIIILLY